MGSTGARPAVIAHRGASGYLPEHSLAAKALGHAMGADYLEQDIVASRDGEALVFHDVTLDAMTDVAARFPGRARPDGHHYCIDFDLDEIRDLRLHERVDPKTGTQQYPSRFPRGAASFRITTLEDELRFIRGLNQATGRQTGIYPEIKRPRWHRQEGCDLTERVLTVLERFGYLAADAGIVLQCFDAAELKRIRKELGNLVPLLQLVGSRDAEVDLQQIACYAHGIGPAIGLIYLGIDSAGRPRLSGLVEAAHRHGLIVHPYTFRADALPDGMDSLEALFDLFVGCLEVDGVFTDFPDRAVRYLEGVAGRSQSRAR